MKVLVLDTDGEGCGVDIAYRAQGADHDVRYWLPPEDGTGRSIPYGDGLVDKVREWEPSMDWAELIILIGNAQYGGPLNAYFGKGYPIFGANARSAELELDRAVGQKVLEDHGIETLPYIVCDSIDDAIKEVVRTGEAYCLKPWGGETDKSMTCVARSADEAIFNLLRWKKQGLKGRLVLQEKAEGVEIGISGMFGPNGWNAALEESFEHKKFMNDDVGENTGEMGTVIRHVKRSVLFDTLLEPLTDYLHGCKYVGDCNVNAIVDKDGTPWPLEFTMRLGWPDFCIRQAVIRGDPVKWMADLIYGQDSLEVSTAIAAGVLMAHGDFPKNHDPLGTWAGFPIDGITTENEDSLHWQEAMRTECPFINGKSVKMQKCEATAGNYVVVCSGTGKTVKAACRAAYDVVEAIRWPSNVMYRTDIGERLKKELPLLQKHGIAEGVEY